MFKCNHKTLTLYFNEFHNVDPKDMPQYDEFCLLELADGRYTGGKWHPNNYKAKSTEGNFGRGTADVVESGEVSKWHSLDRYDLSNCLENEEIGFINVGVPADDGYRAVFKDFKSFADGDFPKSEQYCLLIMNDGGLAAGRWDKLDENDGMFIYASALSSYDMEKVWAWTPLSPDDIFAREEEYEKEKQREKELNKNPVADISKFKYGTDINTYYEKALEKLRKDYPWATLTQMKKRVPYVIVPKHGQYVFGQDNGEFMGSKIIDEWTEGNTAEEFIDFLCEYTKQSVIDANPDVKFSLGTDIEVYLDKAYANVKREYTWIDKKKIKKACRFEIREVDGDLEFVRYYNDGQFYVCDCDSAERFIERVESDYQSEALRSNPVVAEYPVKFGQVEMHGWYLEKYVVSKLGSGDYKVNVQAGDRVTGGGREFFITPHCFEAKTYDEFLDRYQEIVPGSSFGLSKKDLLADNGLKKFLGYGK